MGAVERSASSRQLLSRRVRLRRHEDFSRVFADNFRASDDLLTVLARANGQEHARIGLAVSRKALPRAVDRNRVKRFVREEFRLSQDALPAADFVVLAHSRCKSATGDELRRSLQRLWQRLSARCKS